MEWDTSFFIGLFLLRPGTALSGCTLFSAVGSGVEEGGALIGKTRDQPEPSEQAFVTVRGKGRFQYCGICTKGKSVTSGINEKGLIVVNAAGSHIEGREKKATSPGKILSRASSVEEVIEMLRRGKILGPIFCLVGDRQQIALIEVAEKGRYAVEVKKNGILFHTNHFIFKELTRYNPKIGKSSSARLQRIEQLLSKGPFTREAFIAFTKDHENGPGDHSICHHFEKDVHSSERTISAAVYYLPRGGPPEVWVSLGQPCQSIFEKY
jgi:isopenicillin-N N-acyltransferase-like protein